MKRRRIVAVVGIVWGIATVAYGFSEGVAFDGAYDVGRVGGYLFGWLLIGAGIGALHSSHDRELDLL